MDHRTRSADDAGSDRGPHHWTKVTQVHTLHATRYQDGSFRLTYGRVDMGTRRLVTEDLGEIDSSFDASAPGKYALANAAERLLIDLQAQQGLW